MIIIEQIYKAIGKSVLSKNNKSHSKVYLAEYHNGQSYEDFHQWHGNKVYTHKEDCLQEILDNGFIRNKNSDDEEFIKHIIDYYDNHYAQIKELVLVG